MTEADAPAPGPRPRRASIDDRLDLLVNNAGASWRGEFADGGYANVRRTMELNFDAVVRMTEALLPLLRRSSPSSIVNVSSTAGRVSRAGAGAYSASKFALAGWSDSLYAEEQAHGVHVGLVLPGFIATEGFPAEELRARALTRWLVSTPEKAAEAIVDAGPGGRAERYVPRPYALAAVSRIVLPGLVRRILAGGGAAVMTTSTGADAAEGTDGDAALRTTRSAAATRRTSTIGSRATRTTAAARTWSPSTTPRSSDRFEGEGVGSALVGPGARATPAPPASRCSPSARS